VIKWACIAFLIAVALFFLIGYLIQLEKGGSIL